MLSVRDGVSGCEERVLLLQPLFTGCSQDVYHFLSLPGGWPEVLCKTLPCGV